MKKTISIICPLYNAEKYIVDLNKNINKQKKVYIEEILYLLTESSDNSKAVLEQNDINYKLIRKNEFSHSLTREKAAFNAKGDILVFITQDVVIENDDWLYELTKPIIDNKAVACYSRQVTKYNNIEKYIREFNYPDKTRIVSSKDLKKLGLKTFFFSDASSAIRTDIFKKLNGYDQKKLPISEDMYIAYKIVMEGYKICYCSQSIIYHSHKFKLRELYARYKLTGKFFKENSYLDQYGTNGSGASLAKYVLKRIIQEKRVGLLFRYPFDMGARFLGMKVGKRVSNSKKES